jgi:hypothetical protein
MKLITTSAFSLFLGILIGWLAQHGRSGNETDRVVAQMVQTIESSDATEAARDVRVISLLQSGETQKAVQLLCTPIAHYYYTYEAGSSASGERLQLHGMIDDLASTNSIVGIELTNRMANYNERSVEPASR